MNMQAKDLLVIDKVTKIFPGVKALDNVTFSVRAGEVHGLVGENGAGKSTLMAVASGALVPEEGTVLIDGQEALGDPELARRLGLAIVRQEPALMPDLTVAENLYMAMPANARPSPVRLQAWAADRLRLWDEGVQIDPSTRVASLNSEQKFIVEIVKALAAKPKVLVLDEPTEHLGNDDVKRLFAHIHRLVGRGSAVIYISHRIREVQSIAQRLTVLRDGQDQGSHEASRLCEQDIVELIVGGELNRDFPRKPESAAAPVSLQVKSFSGKGFNDLNLSVRQGEIVGLAGIDGNGQREFIRALAGINRSKGKVVVDGRAARVSSAASASAAGIRYVPGDRHKEGIFAELSIRENFSLRSLARSSLGGFISPSLEEKRAVAAVNEFAVKTPSLDTPIRQLSGGNQQKVVLSSVLASEPSLLIVDEPTQGVDIGARMEIYQTLRATADKGTGVLLVSSDASEVAGLCDRVMIFSRGEIVKELVGSEVTEQNITGAVLTATNQRAHIKRGISGLWAWAAGDWAPLVMLILAIGVLGLYAANANEFYLSERNISGMLALVATLALVAFGQQILMLVGGIDLSVGPLMGFVVVIQSFYLVDGAASSSLVGWVMVFAAAVTVGVFNWLLVDPLKMHPMVATLVTFMGLQACSLVLRPEPGGLISESVMDAINQQYGFIPLAIIVVLLIGLLLECALFKSRWGLSFRGYGSRPEAARVAGVKPRLVLLGAYVGCSLMAAVAAIPMMAQVGSGDASAGTNYTLTSIAAVVIGGASLFGGRGSFLGAFLGALLITQVNVVTTFLDLSDAWQSYLLGAMILVSVALYSKKQTNGGVGMNVMKTHHGISEESTVKGKTFKLAESKRRWLVLDEFSWVWFGTAALFIVSAVLAPGTVTRGSLLAMLPFAGMLAIVATGQTVVIQQRGLDMSAVGMVALAGVLMAILGNMLGSQLLAALLTVAVAVVVGVLNGFLTSRLSISPLVATLAVNALLIGGVRSLTGNAPVSAAQSLQEFSHSKFLGLPFSVLFAFLFVLVVWVITRKTAIGRRFIAVGINPAAALAAGVRVNSYQVGAYVVSAVCFAVAGMLLAGFIGSASHTAGNDYLLPAIAAVVVGGTPFTGGKGSVVASAVAALFMAQLGQMVLAMGASAAIQLLVQALAILIAIAVRNVPGVIRGRH